MAECVESKSLALQALEWLSVMRDWKPETEEDIKEVLGLCRLFRESPEEIEFSVKRRSEDEI